jgi:hypothetical protein
MAIHKPEKMMIIGFGQKFGETLVIDRLILRVIHPLLKKKRILPLAMFLQN